MKNSNYIDRIMAFDTIYSALGGDDTPDGAELCINEVTSQLGLVSVKNRFGTPSAYGEAWIGMLDGIKVAIKKMTVTKSDLGESHTELQFKSGDSAWGEIVAYQLFH